MLFLKETDYHGSRRYDGRSPQLSVDHFRLRMSLLIAWVGLQIRKGLHFRPAPSRTTSLIDHGQKHFSSLGGSPRAAPARRAITDIFPIPDTSDRPGTSLTRD